MPQALAVVWEMIKSNLLQPEKYGLLLEFDKVLGLNLHESGIKNQELRIPEEITKLAQEREQVRKEKRWEEADRIRQELKKKGFTVEDTPAGPRVKKFP